MVFKFIMFHLFQDQPQLPTYMLLLFGKTETASRPGFIFWGRINASLSFSDFFYAYCEGKFKSNRQKYPKCTGEIIYKLLKLLLRRVIPKCTGEIIYKLLKLLLRRVRGKPPICFIILPYLLFQSHKVEGCINWAGQ